MPASMEGSSLASCTPKYLSEILAQTHPPTLAAGPSPGYLNLRARKLVYHLVTKQTK